MSAGGTVPFFCHRCGYHHWDGGPCTMRSPIRYTWSPPQVDGWRCPVCGRGNSPTTSTCPCVNPTLAPTC